MKLIIFIYYGVELEVRKQIKAATASISRAYLRNSQELCNAGASNLGIPRRRFVKEVVEGSFFCLSLLGCRFGILIATT